MTLYFYSFVELASFSCYWFNILDSDDILRTLCEAARCDVLVCLAMYTRVDIKCVFTGLLLSNVGSSQMNIFFGSFLWAANVSFSVLLENGTILNTAESRIRFISAKIFAAKKFKSKHQLSELIWRSFRENVYVFCVCICFRWRNAMWITSSLNELTNTKSSISGRQDKAIIVSISIVSLAIKEEKATSRRFRPEIINPGERPLPNSVAGISIVFIILAMTHFAIPSS